MHAARSALAVASLLVLLAVSGGDLRSVESAAAAGGPAWDGTSEPLPAEVRRRMNGISWHPGCPVALDRLRLLRVPHWGLDGELHRGRLVVRAKQTRPMLRTLRRLYEEQFPIAKMRLIDAYDGDDEQSMADNNTSAFNCRRVPGTGRWSEHAYGRAIDINPVQNPYVRGDTVEPEAGRAYLDRSDVRPGMVVRPGTVVHAFRTIGWGWGGAWSSSKDYQHFSSTGR